MSTYPVDHSEAASGIGWRVFAVFAGVFVLSSFADATGRYLLPLWVPAAIGVALALERVRARGRSAAAIALALLLAAQALTVIGAARTDVGLQPQLVERLQIPRGHDQDVIDFLRAGGYAHGYASYWAAYRLTFLARETLILDATLPHETKTVIGSGNRYAPYAEAVDDAPRVAWITQNFPELDAYLSQRFAARGVRYAARDFGPYRVYVDFSERIAPRDIGLADGRRFSDVLRDAGIAAPDG